MSRRASIQEVDDHFNGGIMQDLARPNIPPGGVYDALNMIVPGTKAIHRRGAIRTALSSTAAFNPLTGMGSLLDDALGLSRVYMLGVGAGSFSAAASWTPPTYPTVTAPLVVDVDSTSYQTESQTDGSVLQGFNYATHLVFPVGRGGPVTGNLGTFVTLGGADLSVPRAAITGTAVMVAGTNQITGLTSLNAAYLGGYIEVPNAAATTRYFGKITTVDVAGNSVTVFPTPTSTYNSAAGGCTYRNAIKHIYSGSSSSAPYGVGCGCSWQNRIIAGDIAYGLSGGNLKRHNARIAWSILPTEVPSSGEATGYVQATAFGFETNNYLDVGDVDIIVGLVPLDDSRLLILGTRAIAVLTGVLTTELASTRSLSYSVQVISNSVNCLSTRSIARTPYGPIWAGSDGVYLYNSSNQLVNLTLDKVQDYYIANYAKYTTGPRLSTLNGVYIQPGHYMLTGGNVNGEGLVCNVSIPGAPWVRWTNTRWSNNPSGSCQNPLGAPLTYQTMPDGNAVGTPSSKTMAIISDAVTEAAGADAGGTTPSIQVKTRVYTERDSTRLKRLKHVRTTATVTNSVTLTAVSGVTGAGASQSLGALTVGTAVASQFDPATPVISQGWALQFDGGATTTLDLYAVSMESHELNRKRTS